MEHEKDIIQENLDKYNSILKDKASKSKEIEQMKERLNDLEVEYSKLESDRINIENILQADIYHIYSKKDLLKLVDIVEKYAKKEVVADFKIILQNFETHNLGVNDITQLQTYIKLYGKYVVKENSLIKSFFKAFGGKYNG